MNTSLLVYGVIFMVYTYASGNYETPPPPKPLTRNFMVTECVKKVCLMKMKPHVKVVNPDGTYTWVKIQ